MLTSVTVIICGIIFGEAIALLIGTSIIPKKTSNWLNKKNAVFLVLDILAAIMLLLALPNLHYLANWIFYAVLLIAIGSHIYRTYEYYTNNKHKFCDNLPLFLVNNVKLAGLLFIAVLLFK